MISIMRWIAFMIAFPMIVSCVADNGENFYLVEKQKNKFFLVDRKNVDHLTPATVLSLRDSNTLDDIPEYLGTLCKDYTWMTSKRFIHIFESSEYSRMFDTFGIENIKMNKPIEKYIAYYNPDEEAVIFFPLVQERRRKVYLKKGWCKTKKETP